MSILLTFRSSNRGSHEGCDREAGESNLFLYKPSNPNISTRDALKRAQQILGTTKAEIKIFYDPGKEKE